MPDYNGISFNYTRNLETSIQSQMFRLRSFYCREDVEAALEEVKKAPRDAYISRRHDLEMICRARGLDINELLEDPGVLVTVPTRAKLQDELLEILYEIHTSFPNSADYMTRIVRHLAPEYQNDTVRTAILKKFVMGGGFHWRAFNTKEIIGWAIEKLSEEERREYDTSAEARQLILAVSKLDDTIFSKEHMSIELDSLEILRLMINRLKKSELTGLSVRQETETALHTFCDRYGLEWSANVDTADILRLIVDAYAGGKLTESDAVDQMEPFFELLKTDFWAQIRKVTYTNQSGKTDTVATLYKNDLKDARKRKKRKLVDWELLRLCDDFAAGKFRTNSGKTRVYLYYFAIMFDMSIKLRETDAYDPKTDMVKNLFEDYYSDNLIRFLNGAYSNPNYARNYEREPAGDGINYKNFAEVTYLYYLYHKELCLTPGERIDRAETMIDRCIEAARDEENVDDILTETKPVHTEIFREMYLSQMIDLGEDKLVDFILRQYLVHAGDPTGTRIMLSSEEHTAYDILGETMEDLEEAYAGTVTDGQEAATADYGTAFDMSAYIEDAEFMNSILFDWESELKLAERLREKYPGETDFLRVIDNLDQRLSVEVHWFGARIKRFLAWLLHILYHNSTEDKPIRMNKLRESLDKIDVTADGVMINKGVKILSQMGFKIGRVLDQNGGSAFWLHTREYPNAGLNAVINKISEKYWFNEDMVLEQLDKLLEERNLKKKRIGRSALIAVYASYYITMLGETVSIETFPDLYDDFVSTINPILGEARYQPLSEKNILDMYVLFSLYFYVVKHGKERE